MKKYFLLSLLFGLVLLPPWNGYPAEVTGPEELDPGTIGIFEADIPGEAVIFPENCQIETDSNRKRFYIAGTSKGSYTFLFFGVEEVVKEDGSQSFKPTVLKKTFRIGEPTPTPDPGPEPAPRPGLTQTEKDSLAWCLNATLDAMESGRLTTPAGVRSGFKTLLTQKFITESDAVGEILDRWSEDCDWTGIPSITQSFESFLKEIGAERKRLSTSRKVQTCPTGTCPTTYPYYWGH